MKKILIAILFLGFIIGGAYADELVPGISGEETTDLNAGEISLAKINVSKLNVEESGIKWNNGVGYSLIDNKFIALSTIELLKKSGFSLSAGWGGDSDSVDHRAVLDLSYEIANLQKWGVETPIIKYIDISVGVYAGMGNINFKEFTDGEFDYGLSLHQTIKF